ncbi:MAG: hypothetical protein A2571_01555 [Candidatus Vogelbacteria bacterium RIFOXYD1_FULL_44_32]|uniref:Peptidase S1 domain-containing protein n=1 Tax=Candidatus Vogelbacteria bacterium RIFOXYD1_FULL_44_32 TaxID=1802438 RepID=A0A1G2QD80_9BACT|nr:MAG: hypothetical protein A2571_01555 [Candidatus Vogelbacteria bacterium RIFOXYD1_FULL_44_32]
MPQVIPLEILNNCVVNLRQETSAGDFKVGTGILIGKDNKLLLLTAEHVARDMKNDEKLILRVDNNLPISLEIIQVCKLDNSGNIPYIMVQMIMLKDMEKELMLN